jgi:GT2 family glycosyltransferase
MSGDCILIRKSVLDKVGGFDERFFMYAEDGDLSRRIIQHGWKLFYLSKISIVHAKAGASDKTISYFSLLMMCESTFKYNLKYYGLSGALLYRFFVFLSSIFKILLLSISFPAFFFFHKKQICKNNIIKCIVLIKWSLFISRPIISS